MNYGGDKMSIDYIYMKDDLKDEYLQAFEKVEMYSTVIGVDSKTDGEMMMNLLDMLLTAQSEGKPVEKIVGNDIEEFCKSYFQDYGSKERTVEFVNYIKRIMWVNLVFSLIDLFIYSGEEGFSIWTTTTDIAGFVGGFSVVAIVYILLNAFVKPRMFKWKKVGSGIFSVVVCILLIGLLIVGIVLTDGNELGIPLLPSIIVSALYLIVYYIFSVRKNLKEFGTIRKPKDKDKMKFSDYVNKLVEESLPQELAKRYEKENKKLARKGKPAMTPEEYMDKLRKENEKSLRNLKWGNRFVVVFVIALITGMIVAEAVKGSEIVDLVIYAAVLIAFEIPLLKFFISMDGGYSTRIKVFEECDRQGITILEYAERIEAEKKSVVNTEQKTI